MHIFGIHFHFCADEVLMISMVREYIVAAIASNPFASSFAGFRIAINSVAGKLRARLAAR